MNASKNNVQSRPELWYRLMMARMAQSFLSFYNLPFTVVVDVSGLHAAVGGEEDALMAVLHGSDKPFDYNVVGMTRFPMEAASAPDIFFVKGNEMFEVVSSIRLDKFPESDICQQMLSDIPILADLPLYAVFTTKTDRTIRSLPKTSLIHQLDCNSGSPKWITQTVMSHLRQAGCDSFVPA